MLRLLHLSHQRKELNVNDRKRMPVLFVGHGSPMNAIEQNAFTEALAELGRRLPRPEAVCVVSAHWETRGTEVLAVAQPRTIHDFYGFPAALYRVEYPAPGAPGEAERVARDLQIQPDETWGFDHGAWSVLRHIYPQADVPVFELSLDAGRSLAGHVELGRELAALRDRGVLIVGSGNIVHNLRYLEEKDAPPLPWAVEFDAQVKQAIDARDIAALAAPARWGKPLAALAHPTLEHYVPLLYCQGSTTDRDTATYPYEGFEHGSLSMRMVRWGEAAA
jgi:4,5-DOPA dioxygenase extradiol